MFSLESYFSLTGAIWLLSVFMIAVSAIGLFSYYILPWILTTCNESMLEILCYGSAVGLLTGSQYLQGYACVLVAFTGCIAILGCLCMSCAIRDKETLLPIAIICAVVWAVMAVLCHSRMIGFIAVTAVFATIGFTALSKPFCLVIGFKDDTSIPRCMGVSVYLIAVYVWLRVTDSPWLEHLQVFHTGILFMGPLAFFIGCLIVSTKWYHYSDTGSLIWCNVLTVAALGSCFLLGSQPGLESLHSFAVIFGTVWLMDKYAEIPWGKVGWMWGMFTFGVFLYIASFYAHIFLENAGHIDVYGVIDYK